MPYIPAMQSFRRQSSYNLPPPIPTSPLNPNTNSPKLRCQGCASCLRQRSRGHDKSRHPCVHENHPKKAPGSPIQCPSRPRKEAMAWVARLPSCRGHRSSRPCSAGPHIFLLTSWAISRGKQNFAMTRTGDSGLWGWSTHHGETSPPRPPRGDAVGGGVWRGWWKERREVQRGSERTRWHGPAWSCGCVCSVGRVLV